MPNELFSPPDPAAQTVADRIGEIDVYTAQRAKSVVAMGNKKLAAEVWRTARQHVRDGMPMEQIKSFVDQNYAPRADTTSEKLRHAGLRASANLAEAGSGAATWVGLESAGTALREYATTLRPGVEIPAETREALGEFDWGDLSNPEYWKTKGAEQLFTNLPIMAAMYFTGGAIAGVTGSTAVGAIGGGASGAAIESLIEAGDAYNATIKAGGTREQAGEAAKSVWGNNLAGLTGSNAAELAIGLTLGKFIPKSLRGGFTNWVQSGKRAGLALGGMVASGGIEGAQELAQQYYQDAGIQWALGKRENEPGIIPPGEEFVNRIQTPEGREAFAMGAIMGFGMSGVPAAVEGSKIIADRLANGELTPAEAQVDLAALKQQIRNQAQTSEELRDLAGLNQVPVPDDASDRQIVNAIAQKRRKVMGQQIDASDAAAVPADQVGANAAAAINELYGAHPHMAEAELEVVADNESMAKVRQQLGAVTNAEIVFVRSPKGSLPANGYISSNGQVILVDVNAQNLYSQVLGHEATHRLEQEHPDLFKEIVDLAANDKGFNKWLADLNAAREEGELRPLTPEEARSEHTADFVGKFVLDPQFLTRVAMRKPGVVAGVEGPIRRLMSKLTGRIPQSSPQAKELNRIQSKLEKVFDRWAGRVNPARARYKGKKSEKSEGKAPKKAEPKTQTREEAQQALDDYTAGKPQGLFSHRVRSMDYPPIKPRKKTPGTTTIVRPLNRPQRSRNEYPPGPRGELTYLREKRDAFGANEAEVERLTALEEDLAAKREAMSRADIKEMHRREKVHGIRNEGEALWQNMAIRKRQVERKLEGKLHPATRRSLERLHDLQTRWIDGHKVDHGAMSVPYRFSLRTKPAPKKTVSAYKAFRYIDGTLYPLYVGNNTEVPIGRWMDAEEGGSPITFKNGKQYVLGDTGGGRKVSEMTEESRQELIAAGVLTENSKWIKVLAYRPGWHAGTLPYNPQGAGPIDPAFSSKNPTDEAPYRHQLGSDVVIAEVELAADRNYQDQYESEAVRTSTGKINVNESGLRFIPEDGYYNYTTNRNNDKLPGDWLISGSLKVNRIISDQEAANIMRSHGYRPQIRSSKPMVKKGSGKRFTKPGGQFRLRREDVQSFLDRSVGDPQENLRKKFSKKKTTGVAKNKPIRFHDGQGRPIWIGASPRTGGKAYDAWMEEVDAWLTDQEIQADRQWYRELESEFAKIFGDRAPMMMMAWLAAQQNVSPTGAMKNVFKVEDRLAGILGDGTKGGLADERIDSILSGAAGDSVGPKLADFVDAGFNKSTRSFMGDNPKGGMPFVADVHTGRDSGHLDQQTIGRLKKMANDGNLFVDGHPVKMVITKTKLKKTNGKTKVEPHAARLTWKGRRVNIASDMTGSPSDTGYEGIAEWGARLTDHLNDNEFKGGNWVPAEAQAVGWMRVLRQYNLPEPTVADVIKETTATIPAEVNFSSGAVLPEIFPALSSYSRAQQEELTKRVMERAVPEVARIIGGSLRLQGVHIGSGYWGGEMAPSVVIRMMGSDNAQMLFMDALAFVSEQAGTLHMAIGKGGKTKRAVFFQKANGDPLTAAEIESLATFAEQRGKRDLAAFSIHELQDGQTGMITRGSGRGSGLTPKGVERVKALLETWATENNIELSADDVAATSTTHDHDWQGDSSGRTYLEQIERLGGDRQVRELDRYRREDYRQILRDEFDRLGEPGQFSLRRGTGTRGGQTRPGKEQSYAPLAGAPKRTGATGPIPELVDIAEKYATENGIDYRRQGKYVRVDPDRAKRIADAYAAMPHAPSDPAVKEAYDNLIRQTLAQYRALEAGGFRFYFSDPETATGNPWDDMRELRSSKSMGVYPTDAGFGTDAKFDASDNPLLADTGIRWNGKVVYANDLFRAVHDAFGHGLEGAGFRASGEENAWQAHVRLFTGSAIGAITSETRGQNSWLNYGPHGEANRTARVEDTVFADQKTGLMPAWTWEEGRVGDFSLRRLDAPYLDAIAAGDQIASVYMMREAAERAWGDPVSPGDSLGPAELSTMRRIERALRDATRASDNEGIRRAQSALDAFVDRERVPQTGRPGTYLVMHGTPRRFDQTVFDRSRLGQNMSARPDSTPLDGAAVNAKRAHFFVGSQETAERYRRDPKTMQRGDESTTYVMFLRAENPLVVDMMGERYPTSDILSVYDDAARAGHDVIVFSNADNTGERLDNIFALLPGHESQVKSAAVEMYREQDPEVLRGAAKAGDVIPPSQRFDPARVDFRFSLRRPQLDRINERISRNAVPKNAPIVNRAIPVGNPQARDAVRIIDDEREKAGLPGRRPWDEVEAEAEERLQRHGVEAELSRLRREPAITDTDMRIFAKLLDRGAMPALRRQVPSALLEWSKLVSKYRDDRADVARSLAIGRDQFESREQRLAYYLNKSILRPKPGLEAAIDDAKKKGETERESELWRKHEADLKKLFELLQAAGIDLATMDLSNPSEVQRVMRVKKNTVGGWGDILYEYWMNAILSGPKTHAANILGTAYAAYDLVVVDWVEAAIARGKKEGSADFAEWEHAMRGMKGVWSKATANARQAWRDEVPVLEPSLTGMDPRKAIQKLEKGYQPGAIGGKKGRFIRTPTRFLLAADEFLKTIYYHMALGKAAYRNARDEGKTGADLQAAVDAAMGDPGSEASKAAMLRAKQLAFQDRAGLEATPFLGGLVRGIASSKQDGGVLGTLAKYLIPFETTPGNLLRYGVTQLTPLGWLTTLAKAHNTKQVRAGKRSNKWVYRNDGELAHDLAAHALSTVAMLTILELVAGDDDGEPFITGGGAPFQKRGEKDHERRNRPPMSVRVGDTWYSYQRIDPLATGLAMMVDLADAVRRSRTGMEREENLKRLYSSIVTEQMKNKTYLKSIGDIMQAVESPDSFGKNMGITFTSSWSPAILRHAASAQDDTVRTYKPEPDSGLAGIMQTIGQRALPAETFAPRPKRDPWGRPIMKSGEIMTEVGWRFASPMMSVDTSTATNLDRLINNWADQNPNDAYYVSIPQQRFTHDGDEYAWTNAEYDAFLKARGERIVAMWDRATKHRKVDYAKPSEAQVKLLKRIVGKADGIERAKAKKAAIARAE